MSRYERRMYFERLCTLRDGYGVRGDEDCTSVLSIAETIAWIEAEMLDETVLHPVDALATDQPAA